MNTSMTIAQLAELVTGHIAEHRLPEPASLHLTVSTVDEPQARVQLRAFGLAHTAAGLLSWVRTQAAVTLESWRPVDSRSVHLDMRTTLSGPRGTAELVVYGGVTFEPAAFPGLEPGQRRPISLGQLTDWADGGTEAAA